MSRKCQWRDVERNEDCSRQVKKNFEFCEFHIRTLVTRGRSSVAKVDTPYLGKVADKFLMAMIGALGAATVTHWDEIMLALKSISILVPEQYHTMFPPAPFTGGPSAYADDEILYMSINGHPQVVVIAELDQAGEFDHEQIFWAERVTEILKPRGSIR